MTTDYRKTDIRFFYGHTGNGFCHLCLTGSTGDGVPDDYTEAPLDHAVICENCGRGKLDGERYARAVTFKRLCPGYYAATGARGEYRIERIDGEWFVTYPGRRAADDVYASLRTAKDTVRCFDTGA